MRRSVPAAVLLALVAASGTPACALETLWARSANPVCRLRLNLADGSVAVRAGGPELRLLGETAAWRIAAVELAGPTGDTLELTVSAGAEGVSDGAARAAAAPAVVLEAPSGCELELRTTHGRIEVSGPRQAPLVAETTTGVITLWVAPAGDLAIDLATSGEITVDFSVAIDYFHHQEPDKQGQIRLGSGATRARLNSRQGAIRVLAQPEVPQSDRVPATEVAP